MEISTIRFSDFPTLTSSLEGFQIGTRKGGGQGTKGIIGSSSKD